MSSIRCSYNVYEIQTKKLCSKLKKEYILNMKMTIKDKLKESIQAQLKIRFS